MFDLTNLKRIFSFPEIELTAKEKTYLDIGGILFILLVYNPLIPLSVGSQLLSFFGFEIFTALYDQNYVIRLDYYLFFLAVFIFLLVLFRRLILFLQEKYNKEESIGIFSIITALITLSLLLYFFIRSNSLDFTIGNICLIFGSIMMIVSGILFLKKNRMRFLIGFTIFFVFLTISISYLVDIGLFQFLI